MKKCSSCKILKDCSMFYKNRTTKDGHSNQCKTCHGLSASKAKNEWYLNNRKQNKCLVCKKTIKNTSKHCYQCGGKNRRKYQMGRHVEGKPYTDNGFKGCPYCEMWVDDDEDVYNNVGIDEPE